MALAFHRKYRPRKLGDLVGQEENVTILKRAAQEDRLGQAYLFYGPRGTGKTTTARLLAKLLNCEKRNQDSQFLKQGEPCGDCKICREIDDLSAIDLIEIDAASNRGIDEMRNLKENIRTVPASSKYKIYIIDEAHMLTREAANALLKTLEEPPAHAALILATTEYEKLPPTITSRTQRFVFRKLHKMTIVKKLEGIIKEEGIKIEPQAIELIAALAEGSLRDAESLLDQVSAMAFKGKKGDEITVQYVEGLTGRTSLKTVEAVAQEIVQKNLKEALAALTKIAEEGHDPIRFARDLIHYLRKAISLKLNPNLAETFTLELTSEELETLRKIAAPIDPKSMALLLRALIRAYADMRYSPFTLIPLEMALTENL
ncbi:MAG: DNA polymerase III subunit gamma/tau [Anaplasmataceae bacterium]|nr:DNA polymerase III subunit gamma/tau [Anaplasmataceae bacterium]